MKGELITLRCGKCRRVLARGKPTSIPRTGGGEHVIITWTGAPVVTPGGRIYSVRPGPNPTLGPRPALRRPYAGTHGNTQRETFACHPRCGAVWTVTRPRVAAAYARIRDEGRREIVAGLDV